MFHFILFVIILSFLVSAPPSIEPQCYMFHIATMTRQKPFCTTIYIVVNMYQYRGVIIFKSLKSCSSFMFHIATMTRQKHVCTTIYDTYYFMYGGRAVVSYCTVRPRQKPFSISLKSATTCWESCNV